MRIGLLPAVLMLGCAWAGPLRADLKTALAEPNLGKRSKLALDNAAMALKAAREAYGKGDNEKVAAMVEEIQQSVDLAYDSLIKTGKDPRSSPHSYSSASRAQSFASVLWPFSALACAGLITSTRSKSCSHSA